MADAQDTGSTDEQESLSNSRETAMPEISRFFGMVVTMCYNDHAPPHFHVRYGGQKALISIDPPTVLEGRLSPRPLGLVVEWASLHREELSKNWDLARQEAALNRIAPLE
jgi:hypothetical protein